MPPIVALCLPGDTILVRLCLPRDSTTLTRVSRVHESGRLMVHVGSSRRQVFQVNELKMK